MHHLQGKDNYRIDRLADDIASLVKALGHESCTLVAHDWGGVISWLTAHAYGSLVDKLVVICAPHPKCEYDLDQYKRYNSHPQVTLLRLQVIHQQTAVTPQVSCLWQVTLCWVCIK